MGQLCTMGQGSIQFWKATAMLAGTMDCKETQAEPHSPCGFQVSLDTFLPVERSTVLHQNEQKTSVQTWSCYEQDNLGQVTGAA